MEDIKKGYIRDSFKCKRKVMRRKEVALRFIAYNVFIMLCYNYSVKHNLPLYVWRLFSEGSRINSTIFLNLY